MKRIIPAEEKHIPELLRLLVQVNMVHHNGRPDLFKGPTTKYDADELAADWADWLRGKPRIGITGGTSTPEDDLEEVRERIYVLTA